MTRHRGAEATPARPRAPPASGNARAASAARAPSATGPAAGERRPLPRPRARPPRNPGAPTSPRPTAGDPCSASPLHPPDGEQRGFVRRGRERGPESPTTSPREPTWEGRAGPRRAVRGKARPFPGQEVAAWAGSSRQVQTDGWETPSVPGPWNTPSRPDVPDYHCCCCLYFEHEIPCASSPAAPPAAPPPVVTRH